MMKKGYKVVTRPVISSTSRLISVWTTENQAVVYVPGKWVYPQEDWGPLAVFTSLKEADTFRGLMCGCRTELWACDYYQSNERSLWSPSNFWVDSSTNTGPSKYIERKERDCPKDTDFAYQVRLTRRIK